MHKWVGGADRGTPQNYFQGCENQNVGGDFNFLLWRIHSVFYLRNFDKKH